VRRDRAQARINANPTCTLVYGDGGQGALGYLVGEANRGLEYMFVMMNAARFSVGVQGLALADRAYQHAVEYAKERIQFRDAASRDPKPVAIIKHPDVRRMLLWCKANIEAMRALAYVTAASLDYAHKSEDEAVRKEHKAFVELMIPIVKGWLTERAIDVCSTALQVFGGWAMSKTPESRSSTATCASRRSTKARPESRRSTSSAASWFATWARARPRSSSRSASSPRSSKLGQRRGEGARAAARRGDQSARRHGAVHRHDAMGDLHKAFANSVPFLNFFGIVAGGWQLFRGAKVAAEKLAAGDNDPFYTAKIQTATFYAHNVLSQSLAAKADRRGSGDVMAGTTTCSKSSAAPWDRLTLMRIPTSCLALVLVAGVLASDTGRALANAAYDAGMSALASTFSPRPGTPSAATPVGRSA